MSHPADIAADAPDADAREHSRRLLDSIWREADACAEGVNISSAMILFC